MYVFLHPMAQISAYAGTDIPGSPQKFVTPVCGVLCIYVNIEKVIATYHPIHWCAFVVHLGTCNNHT